jgi:hypothetical protein
MTIIIFALKWLSGFLSKLPWQIWAVLVAIGICYASMLYGEHLTQIKWNASIAAANILAKKEVNARIERNTVLKSKQTAISENIQGIYDDEIKNFTIAANTNDKRVRVGTAICPSVARQTDTHSAKGSDATDPTSGLVSADTQRSIDALILKVEEGLAAGRACQAFVQQNGMAAVKTP